MMFLYIYIVLILEMQAAVLGVRLDQGQKALIKAESKTVYLPCKVTDLQDWNYIHWYQMKDGEAPSRLLYISQKGDVTRDTNNPQVNDFTVDKTKLYDLKLSNTQKKHAAVYFCAYWDSSSHSCLNGQPTHPLSLLIKARGRTARIQCKVASSTLQSNALHWYRLKDQAFQRLMYFEAGSKKAKLDSGVPSRYSGSVGVDLVTLTISTLEQSDAGSYYCALWSEDNKHSVNCERKSWQKPDFIIKAVAGTNAATF